MPLAIFGLGPLELVIIIIVIIVLFLPSQLPKLVKRLSESINAVRDMTDKDLEKQEEEDKKEQKSEEQPPSS
jgi:sec-independent protein translocase protein TatA